MPNILYYGDNLDVLRKHIADESVDLIYLDPPFNSNRDYNILFKDQSGEGSPAQIKAFDDTWNWAGAALVWDDFANICPSVKVIDLMSGFINTLGKNSVTAYLIMMAPRLFHLHRILKSTGSFYLHCDPTASHYLKLLLDCVFDARLFRSEIIWRRSASHGGAVSFNDIHDTILYYSKSAQFTWNPQYGRHDEEYIRTHYYLQDEKDRYQLVSAHGLGAGPVRRFGDKVIEPPSGRHWAWTQERIDELMSLGRIVFTRTGMPRYKRYLNDTPGTPLGTVWTDIPPVNSQAQERLGYPTQKPQALLERIINASSNPGDTVLDPFCGCGTAVAAAQKLGRAWIGIDITPIATSLIQKRLWDQFEAKDRRLLTKNDTPTMQSRAFIVEGLPTDTDGARTLFLSDHKKFEMWAVGLVPAIPQEKKGADQGIDGVAYFNDGSKKPQKAIVQVKGGHVGSALIRDLRGTKEREKAALALFICLEQPTSAMRHEALEAGYYQAPNGGRKVEALQILTIAELLETKRFQLPFTGANVSFLRAATEEEAHPALDME